MSLTPQRANGFGASFPTVRMGPNIRCFLGFCTDLGGRSNLLGTKAGLTSTRIDLPFCRPFITRIRSSPIVTSSTTSLLALATNGLDMNFSGRANTLASCGRKDARLVGRTLHPGF